MKKISDTITGFDIKRFPEDRRENFQTISIRRINGMNEARSPSFMSYRHNHTCFETHIILEGRQVYCFDKESVELKKGEMIIIFPRTFHSIPEFSDDLCKYTISFKLTEGSLTGELAQYRASLIDYDHYVHTDVSKTIISLFDIVFEESEEARLGWADNVNYISKCIINRIISEILPSTKESREKSSDKESKYRAIMAEQFIMDNLSISPDCHMVAQFLHLSEKQLSRDIMHEKNMSLHKLIERTRFEKACDMLSDSNCSFESIAAELGFPDNSSFHRFFKRISKKTPSTYRKELLDKGKE